MPYILVKRKIDGPSIPELGTPTSVTFDSVTVPLARASTGPNAIAQYVLERATSAGGPWTVIGQGPLIFGNPPAQFVDGGRLALTEYFYRARAVDTAGRISAYCAVVSAVTAAQILPSTTPEFPRVACVHYGVSVYGTANGQAGMARFDMVVLNGWETFHTAFNQKQLAEICANVKALNPSIKLFFYLNPPAVRQPFADRPVLAAKVAAENWWLRNGFPSGAIAGDPTYPDSLVNITTGNRRRDGSGRTSAEWVMGDYARGMYVDGALGGVAANPYWDGFFFDNALVRMRVDGDYDENGSTNDDVSDTAYALAYRQGLAEGIARYRQLMPTLKILGNSDFASIRFENRGGTTYPDATLDQVYDGVMTEGLFGLSYSPEVWGTPTSAAQWAQDQEDMSRNPMDGFTHAQRLRTLTSTNWQDARHSICAQLILSNQMVCYVDERPDTFNSATGFDGTARWFDEYDGGGRGKQYLGRAVDLRQKLPFQSGVWRRRFANGDVYWNPRNNGIRTITLSSPMRRIQGRSGFSDTSVNNGQLVTSITLQDRDGAILLRP